MSEEPASHFDHLSTSWTLLQEAHNVDTTSERRAEARGQLLARYEPIIRRYLGGALRHHGNREEAINECFQRFSVKVLQGTLHRAHAGRGKFRAYLCKSLENLVHDFWREQGRQMSTLTNVEPYTEDRLVSEEEYRTICKEGLVARALQELAQQEQRRGGVLYFVMKLKMDCPKLRSRELAERASAQLDRQVNDAWVRKRLVEARRRMCELLRREVSRELLHPTDEEIDAELADLGLLKYCRGDREGE